MNTSRVQKLMQVAQRINERNSTQVQALPEPPEFLSPEARALELKATPRVRLMLEALRNAK